MMPSSADILEGLTTIANDWAGVAIVWHVFLGVFLFSLVSGWRPSPRSILLYIEAVTHGLPGAIRTDNGVPFASGNALFGLSRLAVWSSSGRCCRQLNQSNKGLASF